MKYKEGENEQIIMENHQLAKVDRNGEKKKEWEKRKREKRNNRDKITRRQKIKWQQYIVYMITY